MKPFSLVMLLLVGVFIVSCYELIREVDGKRKNWCSEFERYRDDPKIVINLKDQVRYNRVCK